MKKVFSLLIIVSCFLLVGCSNSPKTIEEIVGVSFKDIDHITIGYNKEIFYDVDKFTKEYKDLKYINIDDDYGKTSYIYYVCYDSNNNVLFTFVEIGNQDKAFIKKGNFDINVDASKSLYQLKK